MTTAASDPRNTANIWGISQATFAHFAVQYNGLNGLVYPSLSGHRHRVLLLNAKPGQAKNLWDNDTRHLPMPPLFNIRCLSLPESQQQGVYLSNGEKSRFVFSLFNENLCLMAVHGNMTGSHKKNSRHAFCGEDGGTPPKEGENKISMDIVTAAQITYNQKSSPDSTIYRDASLAAARRVTVNLRWGE